MRELAKWFLTGLLVLSASRTGEAGFVVSLSTSDDLSHIRVGQTVTIGVVLSGLGSGDSLDSLGATVGIQTPSLFNTPAISVGPIVPSGGGFFPGPSPGFADGTYDDLFNVTSTPLSANGVFFSFSVKALTPGNGSFAFTSIDAFQGFNEITLTNGTPGGLAFSIPSAVPEPSSLLLAGLGVAGLASGGWFRRRSTS